MAENETVVGTLDQRTAIDHSREGRGRGESTNREFAERSKHFEEYTFRNIPQG